MDLDAGQHGTYMARAGNEMIIYHPRCDETPCQRWVMDVPEELAVDDILPDDWCNEEYRVLEAASGWDESSADNNDERGS